MAEPVRRDQLPMVASCLLDRGLRPAVELAMERPHGDRLRYIAGCRCEYCRKANSQYENERQKARKMGDWNGIVPADRARDHLLRLSAGGVGRKAVAAASDVSETILSDIRAGRKANIRARTERSILAVTVDMASDHAVTDAGETWRLIREMLAAGFTKTRLAGEMGFATHALQVGKKTVLVRTAHRIKLVHRKLMSSGEVLVPARPTQRRLLKLVEEGFSERKLADLLGVPIEQCRISRKMVSRAFEDLVRALHERLMA